MRNRHIAFATLILMSWALMAQAPKKLGDEADGNRSVPVHLLKLYDEDGAVIRLDDQPVVPFSTRTTCGECHSYESINKGWHFDAGSPGADDGRSGEPWILTDRLSRTQLPVSRRNWEGVYSPETIGLDPFDYMREFGRHMPGGGPGEDEDAQTADHIVRWMISGNIEINCLSCHDAEAAHDQAEWATQLRKENFRWAAAATSGFAKVSGSAKQMPDNYDMYLGLAPDDPKAIPPGIRYDESRFNESGQVFFDIKREVPAERCYYCHSTKTVNFLPSERWEADEDIHMTAGMTCVDCHRNGLDHQIIRGYEGEASSSPGRSIAAFSCQGCHIPSDTDVPTAGRLSAPVPDHAGIPPVHFEKMSCTSCHSGPWPGDKSVMMKTSRAHALGTHGVDKADDAPPYILGPVFARDHHNKIAPHKLVWPAFWGSDSAGVIVPFHIETVRGIAGGVFTEYQRVADSLAAADTVMVEVSEIVATTEIDSAAVADSASIADTVNEVDTETVAEEVVVDQESPPRWPPLTTAQVGDILRELAGSDQGAGDPVYISGGRRYYLDSGGNVQSTKDRAAQPYKWAFAHDVRPAAQSLGVRGCADCHSPGAAVYFSDVPSFPAVEAHESSVNMTEFQGGGYLFAGLFAFAFYLRPLLKLLMILSVLAMSLVLTIYIFRGGYTITKSLAEREDG